RSVGSRWFTARKVLTGSCTALARTAWMTAANAQAVRLRVPSRLATFFTIHRIECGVCRAGARAKYVDATHGSHRCFNSVAWVPNYPAILREDEIMQTVLPSEFKRQMVLMLDGA